MITGRFSAMADRLRDRIGFLKWVQLAPDDIASITADPVKAMYLSPDVHSLHIVTVESDDAIVHYVEDYDDGKPLDRFIDDAMSNGAWDTVETSDDPRSMDAKLAECLTDYGGNFPCPVKRLDELA